MALQGFDKDYYLQAKLDALVASDPTEWGGKDAADLTTALADVGLTPEQHYAAYGYTEGLAPNAYFNAEEYSLAKATLMVAEDGYATIEAAQAALTAAWPGNLYDHYLQYGAAEGVNPSNAFDESGYYDAKLVEMQKTDPNYTLDELKQAFTDAGLTALSHYELYGKDEGVAVVAVPADEQVDAGGSTPNPGETFTLTTSVDNFVASDYVLAEGETEADVTRTTAGDDIFTGVTSSLSSEKTLNPADAIDGGDGTDTLQVSVKSNFTGFTGDGSMANVENVQLTNDSTIDRTFDASGVTGVESYTVDATSANVVLSDLNAAGVEINYSGAKAGRIDVAFDTAFVAAAGTADAMTFNVDGLGKAAVAATTTTAAVAEVDVTSAMVGIEALTVNATGEASFMDLAGVTAAKSITVTGDADFKVADVAGTVTTFDASTATGNVTAVLTNSGTLTSVATGTGDDTVTLNTASVLANAEIVGGDGADTLVVAGGAKTLQLSTSGFETISTGATMTGDVLMSNVNTTGISTVNVGSTAASIATNKLTMVSMGGADVVVNSNGTQNLATTGLDIDNSGTTTINLNPLTADVTAKTATTNDLDVVASKTADVTVNVAAYTNSNSIITAALATNATLNVASGKSSAAIPAEVTEFYGVLNVAKATSLTVDAAGDLGVTGAATINAAAATSANITTTSAGNALDLIAANLESLEVTAGKDLDLSGSTLTGVQVFTATTGDALNVSALAAASNVTVSGAKAASDATFAAVGTGALDYSTSFTASGLADGLVIDSITAGNGANVTLDVSATTGDVTVTNALTAGGTVTVEADGSTGAIGLGGDLDGNIIVVNAATALGVVDDGAAAAVQIIAGKSVTYNGTDLSANAVDITTDIDGAFTATLNGGIVADDFTITSGAVAQTAITVTGDLGLDANTLDVDASASTAAVTVNLSGMSHVTTSTIDIAGGGNNVAVGSSAVDTITGGAGDDTITGGTGADILDGAAGADTYIVANGDTGITFATADTISFVTGTDSLKLGTAGTTANYAESSADLSSAHTAGADFAAALAIANNDMDGTVIYSFVGNTDAAAGTPAAGAYLFEDTNADGTADQVINLTGLSLATDFAATDIVA